MDGRVRLTDELELEAPPLTPAETSEMLREPKKAKVSTYRPDIDGLRAVAVVPVVAFHAYPSAFPGGFVGVDVFFVISGFLISSILFHEHSSGTFSYARFYTRRVRRLFPALLLVLATTLGLGCHYFLTRKLQALAATLLAGSLFGANLQILALERDYFDLDTKTNPLLHLWSLGVEEQFYLFWPFVAAMAMKLRPHRSFLLQLVVLAISFTLNIALLGARGNNKMSFYLPFPRFWQMALGGLLAYARRTPSPKPSNDHDDDNDDAEALATPALSRLVSLLGGALLVLAYASIDESCAFPGFWALLPSTGALLLLAAGPDAVLNTYVLSHPMLVYIGKISYCWYLWHWPLLVFAADVYPLDNARPAYLSPIAILCLSAIASVVTHEGLEKGLRRRQAAWITPLLVFGMVVLGVLAAFVYTSPEVFSLPVSMSSQVFTDIVGSSVVATEAPIAPWVRAPANATTASMVLRAQIDSEWNEPVLAASPCLPNSTYVTGVVMPKDFHFADHADKKSPETCVVLRPGGETRNGLLLVIGDSHADMLKPRFVQLAAKNATSFPTIVFQTRWGRAFLPCRPEFQGYLAMVKASKPNAVLFVSHWSKYLNPGKVTPGASTPPVCCAYAGPPCAEQSMDDVDAILISFSSALQELRALGIQVFVADQSPQSGHQNPKMWLNGGDVVVPPPLSRAEYDASHAWLLTRVQTAVTSAKATLVDFSKDYGNGDDVFMTDPKGEPLMCWQNHLRAYTARHHLRSIDRIVDAARRPRT